MEEEGGDEEEQKTIDRVKKNHRKMKPKGRLSTQGAIKEVGAIEKRPVVIGAELSNISRREKDVPHAVKRRQVVPQHDHVIQDEPVVQGAAVHGHRDDRREERKKDDPAEMGEVHFFFVGRHCSARTGCAAIAFFPRAKVRNFAETQSRTRSVTVRTSHGSRCAHFRAKRAQASRR